CWFFFISCYCEEFLLFVGAEFCKFVLDLVNVFVADGCKLAWLGAETEFAEVSAGLVQDSVSLLVFVVWPYWQVFASEFFYCPVELAFCFLEGFGLVSALGSEAYESD